jgi:ech hydrogenase subunit D
VIHVPDNEYRDIELLELLNQASELKGHGCRLIQICCSKAGDAYEMDYSFDKDYHFIDLKMHVTQEDKVESISLIFPPAFLYENEIEALFGIAFVHKSVDFDGKLYRTAEPTPFKSVKEGGE